MAVFKANFDEEKNKQKSASSTSTSTSTKSTGQVLQQGNGPVNTQTKTSWATSSKNTSSKSTSSKNTSSKSTSSKNTSSKSTSSKNTSSLPVFNKVGLGYSPFESAKVGRRVFVPTPTPTKGDIPARTTTPTNRHNARPMSTPNSALTWSIKNTDTAPSNADYSKSTIIPGIKLNSRNATSESIDPVSAVDNIPYLRGSFYSVPQYREAVKSHRQDVGNARQAMSDKYNINLDTFDMNAFADWGRKNGIYYDGERLMAYHGYNYQNSHYEDAHKLLLVAKDNEYRKADSGAVKTGVKSWWDTTSFGLANSVEDYRNKNAYKKHGDLLYEAPASAAQALAIEQYKHPIASGAGNIAGMITSYMALSGVGGVAADGVQAVTAGTKAGQAVGAAAQVYSNAKPWVQAAVRGGAMRAAYNGLQTAGHGGDASDTIKSAGRGVLEGAFSEGLQSLANIGVDKLLFNRQIQNDIIPEIAKRIVSAGADSAGEFAADFLTYSKDDRPTGYDLAMDLAVGIVFGELDMAKDYINTSRYNKAVISALSDSNAFNYTELIKLASDRTVSSKDLISKADNVIETAYAMRSFVEGKGYYGTIDGKIVDLAPGARFIGEQKYIDALTNSLDIVALRADEIRRSALGDTDTAATITKPKATTKAWEEYHALKTIAQTADTDINVRNRVYSPEDGENVYGYTQGKSIYAERGSDKNVVDTVKHEGTHMMKKNAPEAYSEYEKYVINAVKNNDVDAFEARKQQLKLNGYSDDEIIEELACEIPELFLRNSKMIENIARRKPEASGKIYDIIDKAKRLLNGSKTYINSDGLTLTYEQLQTAERLWSKALYAVGDSSGGGGDVKYSVRNIVGQNGNYGEGVYLDTDLFNNVKRNKWGKALSEYVYNNLAGTDITVYDDSGKPEIISFANKSERIKKDGADNSHRVIDKLARANADVKGLSIVHIDELLKTSTKKGISSEHTHQWLDENGWEYKKAYVQTKNGGIYETTLNIANAKDGRKILYALSNIKRVDDGVVPSAHKVAHGSHININSDDSISYNRKNVNGEFDTNNTQNKERQLDIINKHNPAPNSYLTWIRDVGDILTLEETLLDPDFAEYDRYTPDLSKQMILDAIDKGTITVYSSYPIEQGGFVTPSSMEAQQYSGNGKVYAKKVDISDVAWISPLEGQYAKVDDIKYNKKDVNSENQTKSENFKKWFGDWENDPSKASKVVNEDGSPKVVYHGTEDFGFTEFDLNKLDDKRSIFLTDNPEVAQTYSGVDGVRKLADYDAADVEKVSKMSISALADELNKTADEDIRYEVFRSKDLNALSSDIDEGIKGLAPVIDRKITEYGEILKWTDEQVYAQVAKEMHAIGVFDEDTLLWRGREKIYTTGAERAYKQLHLIKSKLSLGEYEDISTPLYMLLNHTKVFDEGEIKTFGKLESNIRKLKKIEKVDVSDDVVICNYGDGYSYDIYDKQFAVNLVKDIYRRGNYGLYADIKNPLIVDANGRYWNDLRYSAKNGKVLNKTREVAQYAYDNGYDGVEFRNIKDNGGHGYTKDTSTVYVAFSPEQIKSATDNIGMFDGSNPDIRYNKKNVITDFDDILSSYYRNADNNHGVDSDELPLKELRIDFNNAVEKLKFVKNTNFTDTDKIQDATDAFTDIARSIADSSYRYMYDSEDMRKLTEAKVLLRNTPIYVSEYAKSGELGESYGNFHKKNFGKLRLVADESKGGSITDVYESLRADFPEYLPEVVGDQERLQKLEEFANSKPQLNREKVSYNDDDVMSIAADLLNRAGEKLGVTAPKMTNADDAEPMTLSQLFTNSMQKEHYFDEGFRTEAEKRKSAFEYEKINNKDTYNSAQEYIDSVGVDKALSALYSRKTWSADDTAVSLALIEHFNASKDYSSAVDVFENMREHATVAGQAIQALQIIDRLTPEGQYMLLRRENDKMIEHQVKKMPKERQEQFYQDYKEAVRKDRQESAKRRNGSGSKQGGNGSGSKQGGNGSGDGGGRPVFTPTEPESVKRPSLGDEPTAETNVHLGDGIDTRIKPELDEVHGEDYYTKRPEEGIKPNIFKNRETETEGESYFGEYGDLAEDKSAEFARFAYDEDIPFEDFLDKYDNDPEFRAWATHDFEQDKIDVENKEAEEYSKRTHLDDLYEEYKINYISGAEFRAYSNILSDIDELDNAEDLIHLILNQSKKRKTVANKSVENALRKEDITMLKDIAVQQVFGMLADKEPATAARKASTLQTVSQLLNSRTMLRNVVSNFAFNRVDKVASNMAAVVDSLMGIFTNQRTLAFENPIYTKGGFAANKQGARRSYLDIALDVQTGAMGSKYNGLETSRRTFKGRNPIAGAERLMSYGLTVTDEWMKSGIEHDITQAFTKLRNKGNLKMTDEQISEYAKSIAKYRTFQDDTAVAQLLTGLKDVLNIVGVGEKRKSGRISTHEFGAGDIVQKYTRVPGNLISRFLEYSPTGYLKLVYNIYSAIDYKRRGGTFNAEQQRKIATTLGRAITGSGFTATFYYLSKKGIFTGEREDESKAQQELENAEGISSTQLNISALGRFIESGFKDDVKNEDGDRFVNLAFLEPLNTLMALGYGLYVSDDKSISSTAEVVGSKVWDQVLDMSTMYTMNSIFKTVNDGGGIGDIMLDVAVSGVTGFIPSMIRQTAAATDDVDRNVYAKDTTAKKAYNRIAQTIPGLRQTLPAKITPFGEERSNTTGNKILDFMNNLVSPGETEVYQTTDVSQELYRLSDYSESVIPEKAPQRFSVGGASFTLYGKNYETFAKLYGAKAYNAIKEVVDSEFYQQLTDDEKAEAIVEVVSKSASNAKKEWATGHREPEEVQIYDNPIDAETARLTGLNKKESTSTASGKYVTYDDEEYELSVSQKIKYDKLIEGKTYEYQGCLLDGTKTVEDVIGTYKATYYYDDMTDSMQKEYLAAYDKQIASARKATTKEKYINNKQRFIDGDLYKQIEVTGNYADLPDNVKKQVFNRAAKQATEDVEAEMKDEIISGATAAAAPVYTPTSSPTALNTPTENNTATSTASTASTGSTKRSTTAKKSSAKSSGTSYKTTYAAQNSYVPMTTASTTEQSSYAPQTTASTVGQSSYTPTATAQNSYTPSLSSGNIYSDAYKQYSGVKRTSNYSLDRRAAIVSRYNDYFNGFVINGKRIEDMFDTPLYVTVDGVQREVTGDYESLDEKTRMAALSEMQKKAEEEVLA